MKFCKKWGGWLLIPIAFLLVNLFPNQPLAESIDTTPCVTVKNLPTDIRVGDTGTFQYDIDPIQNIKATGTVSFNSTDDSLFSVDANGNWTAKKSGQTSVTLLTTLSDATWNDLQKKFPGATFIQKELAQFLEINIMAAALPVYRLYNPNSGEHFYTIQKTEKDQLILAGWQNEISYWRVPEKSDAPVYRAYNPNSGDHHFTTQLAEIKALVQAGWQNEGLAFYAATDRQLPLYRLYNPNAKSGAHHYTPDQNEKKILVKAGWQAENIAWYALSSS